MDRLIGIDYGRRRTGLAVSDPLRIFASALETVDSAKLIDYLKNYAQNETIERFVVGYPVNMDGAPSEAQADVDAFLKHLQKAFPDVPVSLEDERFTSVLAHQVMIDGGMKAKDRRDKKSVDRISAAIILQGYMDRTSGATFAVNPDSVPENRSRKTSGRRKK
jgi:putative Holliday junction resolvase